MGNFDRGGRSGGSFGGRGGRPSFGGNRKSFDNNRGDRPVTMHTAICSECGKTCEVPFRPTGEKPVYCSDCFSKKREGDSGSDRGDRSDRAPRSDFRERAPREFTNNVARPAPRTDFTKPASQDNGDMKKQLSDISSKLDRLVGSIEKLVQAKNTNNTNPKFEEMKKVVPVAMKKVETKKAPTTKTTSVKAPAKKVEAKKAPAKKAVNKKK